MLQIRTVVNSELKYLDLFNDEDIKVEVSFNEVQDITTKNSPFSKTFRLPGSKNNNDIFNHFYDTNSSTFDYNPLQKFESTLVYNGYELYKGYLRLNSVTRTNTDVVYNVTFYSQVGDLVSNIKDKYLSDLQLYTTDPNEYIVDTYPFTLRLIQNTESDPDLSLTAKNSSEAELNGNVYFALLNRGYIYETDKETDTQSVNADIIPRLKWEKPPADNVNTLDYWDSDRVPPFEIPARQVPSIYLTGSLKIKDLYTSIFRENGYNVKSDFFNTAYFNRYYMPLTVSNDDLYPVQSVKAQFAFGETGATTATSVNYICDPLYWQEGPFFPNPFPAEHQRFDLSSYTVDTDNIYFNDGTMILARDGTYILKVNFDYVAEDDGFFQFAVVQRVFDPTPPLYPTTPCWNSGRTISASVNFQVASGDTSLNNEIELEINTARFTASSPYCALDRIVGSGDTSLIKITRINVELIEGPAYTVGNTYDPTLEFVKPDIKQLDFVSGINKLFNLLVIPDPDDPTTLIVEPIIDWIGKGPTLDWSDKIDRSQPITVEPLTNIINGTLDYAYSDDSSSDAKNFKALNNRVFGSNQVELDTDYRDNVTKFDNIFAGQLDEVLNTNKGIFGFTIPNYYTTETKDEDGLTFTQFKPYKTPPKLLFRQPLLPIKSFRTGHQWYSMSFTKIYNWSSNNRFNTYPFGVSGLTHAAVWNKNDRINPLEYGLTAYEDLYEVYYEDYIQDLIDPNNRLLGATIYVTPEEIKNLKFNEKIFVDGNYYRINKITDVSLTNETLAKVQLIKLTREYEGHRVRYYDLINCTGGTDLHTSTDHNFSIYYLKDYRVNIDGICYTVTAGNYNSGYTYQFVDISDAYTDCDCSISIDDVGIEPYDELQPPPTPSPTPTSICGDCIYYEWENENPYFVSVTYRDCDTQILTTDSVGAGQIYTACTCSAYGYRTSGGSLRVNFTEPCYPSTPTPTPSQTPTVTPTVSITPTRTTTPQPTPTNTKTPTVTPTPSPSFVPAPNSYEVINCDDPGDVRCVGSTNFIPVGKVVKLQGIVDLCFEVVGPCETTQVGQVDTEHVSCESCPR